MSEIPDSIRNEEDRIREKYARRKSGDARYSWFNPSFMLMLQDRERRFLKLLQSVGVNALGEKTFLEIGCGDGYWLREFVKWGAQPKNLTGVELLQERAERAKQLSPQRVNILRGSAAHLAFADDSFDLVLQSTVFTSVQDGQVRRQIAEEMMRVVRPEGWILWYDFRIDNPWNPDVTGVPKREILELFAGCQIKLYAVTLAPPLMRRLARWSWLGCYLLGSMPWLCTHYLGVIRKSSTS